MSSEHQYEQSARIFVNELTITRVKVIVHCDYCNNFLLDRCIETNGDSVTFYLEAKDIQRVLDEHKGEHEDAQGT